MSDPTNPLTQFRRSLGLSQEALARKLGLSLSTVSKWEKKEKPTKSSPLATRQLRKLGYRETKEVQ